MIYLLFYGWAVALGLVVFAAHRAYHHKLNDADDIGATMLWALFWPISWLIAAGAFIGKAMRGY